MSPILIFMFRVVKILMPSCDTRAFLFYAQQFNLRVVRGGCVLSYHKTAPAIIAGPGEYRTRERTGSCTTNKLLCTLVLLPVQLR